MSINKKQIEKSIIDAVKHLNDSRLATPVDVINRGGRLSHEVLDCWDNVAYTNKGIDEAILLLESVLEEVYPDSIWVLNAESCKALSND